MYQIARLIACTVFATTLTACLPTPTPPATATPAPTATPGASHTPTPTASATITPTSTLSPTPTDLPEPLTVGVSLREAEREVLSWFDPTRAPRIEWSRYVRRAEFTEAIRGFGLKGMGSGSLQDQWPQSFEDRPLASQSDPMILVIGSTRGIDPMSGSPINGRPRVQQQAQPAAISPERLSVLAVIDSYTGERLFAHNLPDEPDRIVSSLDGLRSANVNVRPDVRRTLTPNPTRQPDSTLSTETPTPVPVSARLTRANLPAALRPTFDAYPLAPGSSWTWRFTHSNSDVRWVAKIITETIESAWLENDLVVVQSRIDTHSLTPLRNQDDDWLVNTPATALRFVTPSFIVGSRSDVTDLAPFTLSKTAVASPFDKGGIASELFVGLLPSPGDWGTIHFSNGPTTITARAGTFDNCWKIERIGGASWGSVRWFCPAVGNVQYGYGDCTSNHCSTAVADLIRWHRATLPER